MLCTCGDGVAGAKGPGRVWAGNPVPRAGHCAPPAHTPRPARSHQATACVAGGRLVWAGPPRQQWGGGGGGRYRAVYLGVREKELHQSRQENGLVCVTVNAGCSTPDELRLAAAILHSVHEPEPSLVPVPDASLVLRDVTALSGVTRSSAYLNPRLSGSGCGILGPPPGARQTPCVSGATGPFPWCLPAPPTPTAQSPWLFLSSPGDRGARAVIGLTPGDPGLLPAEAPDCSCPVPGRRSGGIPGLHPPPPGADAGPKNQKCLQAVPHTLRVTPSAEPLLTLLVTPPRDARH